jgi:uncharacterized protein YkwD
MNRVIFSFAVLASLCFQVLLPVQALDLDRVEKEIHQLTNELRQEKKLPVLAPFAGLYMLARKHSQAMADQHFFAHTDPQGRSPFARMDLFLPGFLSMGSGENIAMRTWNQDDESTVAQAIYLQWKHSPGHYANMVSLGFRHLGVGIALKNNEIYATQSFAKGLVNLQSGPPKQVPSGSPVKMKFEFLADFPATDLSVFIHVPDTKARFLTSSGSFYTGGGPIQPVWLDKTHFEITLPTDKGLGKYTLGIGPKGSYYDTPYGFETVKAKP